MRKGKIFLHHDGALGDTLLSLPCISLIRKSASLVHIAGRRDVAELLHKSGIVDEHSSAGSGLYSSLYTECPDERVRGFLSGFDASFVFTVNPDSVIARSIKSILPDTRVIVTIPPDEGPEHAAEFRLRQFGYSADEAYKRTAFTIPEEERRWAEEVLRQHDPERQRHSLIAMHCGSGGREKNWPSDNYEALIRMIMKNHRMACIVFSGPAEDSGMVRALSRSAERHAGVIHIHNESLTRVAALLSVSDYYIGNDSGISHLAGTMRCRGITLFGPTDARIWRPLGADMDVIRFDGKDGLVRVSAGHIYSRITGELFKGRSRCCSSATVLET